MSNPLVRLKDLGQSVWLDFIRRDLFGDGPLARMIEQDGLAGMTSNPTIFAKAISGTSLYDEEIREADAGESDEHVFERIAVAEIRRAADAFAEVHARSGGRDGFVSLEVPPDLARDTARTIEAARRLHEACDRPNVMIKIPGTREGLPAIETCLFEGIPINVTLLFSIDRYREVIAAFVQALERRATAGGNIAEVHSVASFFVSRVDVMVDEAIGTRLDALESAADREALEALRTRMGIHNARLAYRAFELELRDHPRGRALAENGAALQRPLWASTSTKDPELARTYYVDALAARDTVNTMPPETIEAYREEGEPALRIGDDLEGAEAAFATLSRCGIDFSEITERLEDEGVRKFADSYTELLESIATKRATIRSR